MTKESNNNLPFEPRESNPLAGKTLTELRDQWEQADNTPGEVVDGISKGLIYMEISRRVDLGEDN